ncbi:MAG: ABC transporter ATP-binding protein [Candidatus Binatia bacterium]
MSADGESPSILLRGLRKRFGAREALAGIDLELRGAQMVGVVGPDGAGKTTLLRTIVGLLDVEAEEARVLGFDLREDVRELKRHVGYVPQAFSLYRELSIHENLAFTARLHNLGDAEFAARSQQLLESAGLTPFADRPAGQLSGGMKQKLAIANALLPGPDLLVLDEPTAGIDVVARREIFEVLAALESRVLIVISTSYLEEAALCDHLVYMLGGRVIAQGSPHALESGTGTDAWRAWTDDADAVREAAGALPWVESTRDCGRFVRLEVVRDEAPAPNDVARALLALGATSPAASDSSVAAGLVALAERAPTDLESTLLALARRAGAQ